MRTQKTPRADIRRWYAVYRELGFIVALALVIVAFRVPFSPDTGLDVQIAEQEVVRLEQVEQTKQQLKPPPPPRPPAPIEVANDVVLEEEEFDFDAEVDFDEVVDLPPPPPEREEIELEEETEEIFIVVEEMPELIGGIATIQEHIRYPQIARKAGVQGMVVVQFVVDEKGNVRDPIIIKSVGAGCDEEAVRVIMNHAKFKPGRQRGVPVRVRFSVPIRFQLK